MGQYAKQSVCLSILQQATSAMLGPTFIFLALGAFISVEAARVRPTSATVECPPENCKTEADRKKGSGICPWKEREIEKRVFGEHFGHLMRTKYTCKKGGMDGICCPAERTGLKNGQCLADKTVNAKVRDSQCKVRFPNGRGTCSPQLNEEWLSECVQDQECINDGDCAGNHVCRVGECGRHMTCKGFLYQNANDKGHAPGPELVIQFNDPRSEAHFHYANPKDQKTVLPTYPTTVNFPHKDGPTPAGLTEGRIDKTSASRTAWNELTRQCKKAVEDSGRSWTTSSFFEHGNQLSVSAVFKGNIPGLKLKL